MDFIKRKLPCGSYGNIDGDGYITAEYIQQLTQDMENTPPDKADADGNGKIEPRHSPHNNVLQQTNRHTPSMRITKKLILTHKPIKPT